MARFHRIRMFRVGPRTHKDAPSSIMPDRDWPRPAGKAQPARFGVQTSESDGFLPLRWRGDARRAPARRCVRQNGGYAGDHAPRTDGSDSPLTHNARPSAFPGRAQVPASSRPACARRFAVGARGPVSWRFSTGKRLRAPFPPAPASARPHSPRSRRHRGKGSRETPSDGAVRGRFSVGNRHGPRPRPPSFSEPAPQFPLMRAFANRIGPVRAETLVESVHERKASSFRHGERAPQRGPPRSAVSGPMRKAPVQRIRPDCALKA